MLARAWTFSVCTFLAGVAMAAPAGFVKSTISLTAPPVCLAFDPNGNLYALEQAVGNQATLRTILPDGTFGDSFIVTNDEVENDSFFAGGMAYDAFDSENERLLITDNASAGWLYAVDSTGDVEVLASGISNIEDVAVRSSGEIFVSTAADGGGAVLQIDRVTGDATTVLSGLGFGAGLEFDPAGDLVVQDVNAQTFAGRLQRLPITETPGGLVFDDPVPLLDGMQSGYRLALDSEGNIFTTGSGGLFHISGEALAEVPFDNNGNESQFAAAIAFDPGSLPFEGFMGPSGGRLAYTADGFVDTFITLLTPARPGDYNGDGNVDDADHALWLQTYGAMDEQPADGNVDGATSAADYVAWRKFAPDALANSATIRPIGVPEPAATAMISAIFVMAVVRQRRRNP